MPPSRKKNKKRPDFDPRLHVPARAAQNGALNLMNSENEVSCYGSNDPMCNKSLMNGVAERDLMAITFQSFEKTTISKNWGSKEFSQNAAKGNVQAARLIGYVPIDLPDITADEVAGLQEEYKPKLTYGEIWDSDGAFPTPAGQIPLLRVAQKGYGGDALDALIALQSPVSSPWGIPFIRVATNHVYVYDDAADVMDEEDDDENDDDNDDDNAADDDDDDDKLQRGSRPKRKKKKTKHNTSGGGGERTGTLQVRVYVWMTRLIFELIADRAIKTLMDYIAQPPVRFRDVVQPPKCPNLFKSTDMAEHDTTEYKFSMAGLMKSAESQGYPLSRKDPSQLAVTLYDFQKSTYQWMLDQENTPGGINAHFWQEWHYPEEVGGSMFYFPEAGELRLQRPPHTSGGLLCEEMGLGKTVEVIATILGNPRSGASQFVDVDGVRVPREVSIRDVQETNGMWQSLESSFVVADKVAAVAASSGSGKKTKKGQQQPVLDIYATIEDRKMLINSRATLIVVPPVLLSQWWRELHERVLPAASGSEPGLRLFKYTTSMGKGRAKASLENLFRFVEGKTPVIPLGDTVPVDMWGIGINKSLRASKSGKNSVSAEEIAQLLTLLLPKKGDAVIVRVPHDDFLGDYSQCKPGAAYDEYEVDVAKAYFKDPQHSRSEYEWPLYQAKACMDQIILSSTSDRDAAVTDTDKLVKHLLGSFFVEFKIQDSVNRHLYDHDVVLTNYDLLNRDSTNFRGVHWHRIVLDECQEIKSSTGKVAQECAKLFSNHRWMVSGTPLVQRIEDLHGELNFLRVWPFSLSEKEDGFWMHKIGKPFRHKNRASLQLLEVLISATMMRHSKSQVYVETGEPLVRMPPRTIEWRGFAVTQNEELYLSKWLECTLADSLDVMIQTVKRNNDGRTTNEALVRSPNMTSVRSLFTMVSRILTAVEAVDLKKLDVIRRKLTNLATMYAPGGILDPNNPDNLETLVRKMSGEDIIKLTMMGGAGGGAAGMGMNYDNNRQQANLALAKKRNELDEQLDVLRVEELRQKVLDAGFPVPMTWLSTPLSAYVHGGSSSVALTQRQLLKDTDKDKSAYLKKVSVVFPTGTTLRICNQPAISSSSRHNNVSDMNNCVVVRATDLEGAEEVDVPAMKSEYVVEEMPEEKDSSSSSSSSADGRPEYHLGELQLEQPWQLGTMCAATVTKRIPEPRKGPYKELLLQHATKDLTENTMHGGAFETLGDIMAGKEVQCVICQDPIQRPTITSCVHAFCYDCIMAYMASENNGRLTDPSGRPISKKCPVCRRDIRFSDMMECTETTTEMQEQEGLVTDTSSSSSSSGAAGRERDFGVDEDGQSRRRRQRIGQGLEEEDEEEDEDYGEKDAAEDGEADAALEQEAEEEEENEEVAAVGAGAHRSSRKRKASSSSSSSSAAKSAVAKSAPAAAAAAASSSSSSSSAAGSEPSPAAAAAALSDSETRFVVPTLNATFRAPVESDYLSLPKPRPYLMRQRDGNIPSIAPEPLTHFSYRGLSSRMQAIFADIREVQRDDPFAKFVIFSQYIESLRAIQRQFKSLSSSLELEQKRGFGVALVDLSSAGGSKATEQALSKFNGDPDCNVCLLTMGASAAGLTLTQAKVCYILEPTHNASDEAQALNRVHRIGQQHNVRCVIFYAKQTCEERVLALRQQQNMLTTMLSNLNNITSGDDGEGDIDGEGGGEEEEVVVTSQTRRNRRANANVIRNAAALGGNFFSAGQMTVLFGATEERAEAKISENNVQAIERDQHNQRNGGAGGGASRYGYGAMAAPAGAPIRAPVHLPSHLLTYTPVEQLLEQEDDDTSSWEGRVGGGEGDY